MDLKDLLRLAICNAYERLRAVACINIIVALLLWHHRCKVILSSSDLHAVPIHHAAILCVIQIVGAASCRDPKHGGHQLMKMVLSALVF
ncbi:Hypothetical predicted protein [Olea europaea subsp. europaea]|uniref:Uncharacterized protein n=1 Tax=Olea europaea subsp. europaea TaxID=158383 RepID=A0A8S0VKQ9_OLEEU|nr:Hypothetical predicted protein [Olea europaea subsp. europaea]